MHKLFADELRSWIVRVFDQRKIEEALLILRVFQASNLPAKELLLKKDAYSLSSGRKLIRRATSSMLMKELSLKGSNRRVFLLRNKLIFSLLSSFIDEP